MLTYYMKSTHINRHVCTLHKLQHMLPQLHKGARNVVAVLSHPERPLAAVFDVDQSSPRVCRACLL